MTITEAKIAALKEAAEKATPGPWSYSPWHIEEGPSAVVKKESGDEWFIANTSSDSDAAFIALCREAVPALLAERERLREALKPFADESDQWPEARAIGKWHPEKMTGPTVDDVPTRAFFSVYDLRRARAALGDKTDV